MDLTKSMDIAASGMKAQSSRLKIISQNIANADSTATTPGGEPYRRKTITFKNVLDKATGVPMVKVSKLGEDKSEFTRKYDPSNPAADAEGYVLLPNVNPIIEMTDMREAQMSYEANLNVIDVSKGMMMRTIDLIR